MKKRKLELPDLSDFLRKKRITYDYLSNETGYSKVHLGRVILGHVTASEPCIKLILTSIYHRLLKDMEEYKEIVSTENFIQ